MKDNELEKNIENVVNIVKEHSEEYNFFELIKKVRQKINSDRKYAQKIVDEAESRELIVRKGPSDFINKYSTNEFVRFFTKLPKEKFI